MTKNIPAPDLDGSRLRIAVVVARFNEHITSLLLEGALEAAERCRVKERTVYWVPGSFELPVVAQKLAGSGRY
ncbi:MAG TPA: 6,7-dimethyl-8-ribityllumazine synthase, partial [Dehalococcoidia bacterium]